MQNENPSPAVPVGVTERQAVTVAAADMAAARANAEPFPGALADAFLEGDIEVKTAKGAVVCIRPIVAYDWELLTKLKSPLREQYLEIFKPVAERQAVDFSTEQGYQIAFQFTRPPKESRMLIKKGVEAFAEAAADAMGDKYTDLEINAMVGAVGRQIVRSLAPLIQHTTSDGGPAAEGGAASQPGPDSPFIAPAPPPLSATASGG